MYPIADLTHFFVASLPAIITVIYMLNTMLKNMGIEKYNNNYLRIFIAIMGIIIFSIRMIILGDYLINCNKYKELEHFKYIPTTQIKEQVKEVDKYILQNERKNKKVYILDVSAAVFMIPLDRYNKDYDLFLIGNLGSKSEDGIIEKLNKEENTIILIRNEEYKRNWQNPEKVREYIINNWTKTGQVTIFDIYEKHDVSK